MRKHYCLDCDKPKTHHINTWLSEIVDTVTPPIRLPRSFIPWLDIAFEKIFLSLKLIGA